MESEKCHLGGIIVRDLSCVVSNYRSKQSLSDYCASQDVMGIANVDTRAITRRLRDDGCLNGVICNDASISDEVSAAEVTAPRVCRPGWVSFVADSKLHVGESFSSDESCRVCFWIVCLYDAPAQFMCIVADKDEFAPWTCATKTGSWGARPASKTCWSAS